LAEDPAFLLGQEKWAAGVIGLALLLVDVIAPVPSSVVMLVNGMLFGVGLGTVLSLAGGVGAAGLGFWIGRRGEAGKRWLGEIAFTRAQRFFLRYGIMAVVVSRPVPILAEAVSILAGLSGMSPARFFLAAFIGLLPTAIIYAVAGSYALDWNSGWYVFLAVMVLAGVTWVIGRRATQAEPASVTVESK
jgi:uncharacterized membrane protein YdjX (TVP38/TMEM64 family)